MSYPITRPGPVTVPYAYQLGLQERFQVESLSAVWDGTSAGGSFIPCASVYSQDGKLLGRFKGDATVAGGDSSTEATFAPFLRTGGSVSLGGLALLARTILLVDTPSVTISSIPNTHTHIELYSLTRTDRAAGSDLIALQFNGDTTAAYDWEQAFGNNGVSDAFNAPTGGHVAGPITEIALTSATAATATANSYGSGRWTVLYYTQTTAHKMVVGQGGVFVDDSAAGAVAAHMAGVWRNTAAVTSMTLFPALGSNFKAGSRFELYGI